MRIHRHFINKTMTVYHRVKHVPVKEVIYVDDQYNICR